MRLIGVALMLNTSHGREFHSPGIPLEIIAEFWKACQDGATSRQRQKARSAWRSIREIAGLATLAIVPTLDAPKRLVNSADYVVEYSRIPEFLDALEQGITAINAVELYALSPNPYDSSICELLHYLAVPNLVIYAGATPTPFFPLLLRNIQSSLPSLSTFSLNLGASGIDDDEEEIIYQVHAEHLEFEEWRDDWVWVQEEGPNSECGTPFCEEDCDICKGKIQAEDGLIHWSSSKALRDALLTFEGLSALHIVITGCSYQDSGALADDLLSEALPIPGLGVYTYERRDSL